MRVWDATPEPTPYFLAWCVSNTTVLGIQHLLFWPTVCRGMRVQGATPEPTPYFLGWCVSNTTVLGPTPPLLAHSVQRYACLGRHPRTHTLFFGMVRFKYYHFTYPTTPFQAHRVQRYACLGRHPRPHTLFFWHGAFQHHHLRSPKTAFLAHSVQRYACLGHHSRTHTMGYLGCWCLKRTMPTNIVWVVGWLSNHPYLCTLGQKRCFSIPTMGVFETHNAKKIVWVWGGAPNTHISAHHGPEKACLGT